MRLFLRLGTLLQGQLAVTEAALGAVLGQDTGKTLLLDRALKDVDVTGFAALAGQHGCGNLDLVLVTEPIAEAGWRVIALVDELDNPLLATPEPISSEHVHDLTTLVSQMPPALRAPVEGLLAARADDQRAAALEQLRYAAPPLSVVAELMPMLLADSSEPVRERAIALLVTAGAQVSVVDLVRALGRRDEAAVLRLAPAVAALPDEQQDLALAAAVASAQRGQVTPALVVLLTHLAKHLAFHRTLERVIELLLPARLSLVELVRSVQELDRGRVDAVLRRNLGLGAELDTLLVVLLAGPHDPLATVDEDLVNRGVALLTTADEIPRERMALASALRRLDPRGLAARLTAVGRALGQAADTSAYWALAECCRDQLVDTATADRLVLVLADLLTAAKGPHVVAILEQQLPGLLPASAAVRSGLVHPLAEVAARYIDDRTRDLVGTALVDLGTPAIAPLWRVLEEHPRPHVRHLAAEELATLLERTHADAPTLAAAVLNLVARLGKTEDGPERGALLLAAARLSGLPALDGDGAPALAVDHATGALGHHATPALGHLAAGPHLDHERRAVIVDRLLKELMAEVPDSAPVTETDAATDEVTWVLDDRLGRHTDDVPELLNALSRIAIAAHTPVPLVTRIATRLCTQWRAVAGWRTIWGPANVLDLARTLGRIAEPRTFPVHLRVQVAEALLPRLAQMTVARTLGRVLATGDGDYLADLAGRGALRLTDLAAARHWIEDEGEDLAEMLVDWLAVPHLGKDEASLRRRLVNLLSAQRTDLTSRARTKLRFIMPDLAEELRERLSWA